MESSPHLYDQGDYKKISSGLKIKNGSLFTDDYGDLNDLSTSEISLNLHSLIDDAQFNDSQFNEGFIQELQSLNVDKGTSPVGAAVVAAVTGAAGPKGLSANPGGGALHHNMYSPLAYLPQPVHGGSQFDRPYSDRSIIKEEPQDAARDYAACARVAYTNGGGYCGGLPSYPSMTPATVPGSDPLKSPIKSPGCLIKTGSKKTSDRSTDEYRRRRERNNIAVRKSREKAKARSRETEERVKLLSRENDKLAKKCELLTKEVTVFRSMFANMNMQYLPDHMQREVRKQLEMFQQQHQHLLQL